jgi:Domain of unknown function (DUF4386)
LAATPQAVLGAEGLFRAGLGVHLGFIALCNVFIIVVLYETLRVVSRPVARMGLVFVLLANATELISLIHHATALDILKGKAFVALGEAGRAALAYASIEAFNNGFAISLLVFGCNLCVYGFLILKSGILPHVIGGFLMLAGVCYALNTALIFLAPRFSAQLSPWILMPCLLAESSLALWLLFRGIDHKRWEARLRAGSG